MQETSPWVDVESRKEGVSPEQRKNRRNIEAIIEDPDVQLAFANCRLEVEEKKRLRAEGHHKPPRDNPFLLIHITDQEVATGQKSFREWQQQIDKEYKETTTWFHTKSGVWVREVPRPSGPIGKGYCLKEPGQDSKHEKVCFQCRVIGTVAFGALGIWSFVERMHYVRTHKMRKVYGTLGVGFLSLSMMRAFDLTTLDLQNHLWAWWNSDLR